MMADDQQGGGYGSFYRNNSPRDTFGDTQLNSPRGGSNSFLDTGGDERLRGRGATNLPEVYSGWDAAARGAMPAVLSYADAMQPIGQQLEGEMGRDYQGELMGIARDSIDKNLETSRRDYRDMATRGGFGGGDVSSPLMAQAVELEGRARAGELGLAAQRSVMMAQQMRSAAQSNYQNYLTNMLQSELVPSNIQAAGGNVPVGPVGPSLVGSASAGLASPSISR